MGGELQHHPLCKKRTPPPGRPRDEEQWLCVTDCPIWKFNHSHVARDIFPNEAG